MQTDSEIDSGEIDSGDDPFPEYDVSTPAALQRVLSESAVVTTRTEQQQQRPLPTNALDATAQLVRFDYFNDSSERLRTLFEARADPNVEPRPGDLSVLRTCYCSAPAWKVVEMRQVILDHGAKPSPADEARWKERRHYDLYVEPRFMRRFWDDDREG